MLNYQTECLDERHANIAFDEVVTDNYDHVQFAKLREFHHELIADIKSVFIQWDPDVSRNALSDNQDFYILFIRRQRLFKDAKLAKPYLCVSKQRTYPTRREPSLFDYKLSIQTIELVLCQATNALFHLNEKGLIHR